MSIEIERDTNRKYCYIWLDSKRFNNILQSLGVSPINKNLWTLDVGNFTSYASIPYNIGSANYKIIHDEVLLGYYDYIEFHRKVR